MNELLGGIKMKPKPFTHLLYLVLLFGWCDVSHGGIKDYKSELSASFDFSYINREISTTTMALRTDYLFRINNWLQLGPEFAITYQNPFGASFLDIVIGPIAHVNFLPGQKVDPYVGLGVLLGGSLVDNSGALVSVPITLGMKVFVKESTAIRFPITITPPAFKLTGFVGRTTVTVITFGFGFTVMFR